MNMGTKMKDEFLATYSTQLRVGRLLLALYDVYYQTSGEVQQHANYHATLFEDNIIYSDRDSQRVATVYVVKVNGQLIAAKTREDLQYVILPNGEDNPLLDMDY